MDTLSFDTARSVLDKWKEINFEEKKNEWDSQASEIANKKEQSVNSRKNLAKATKDFRSIPDTEKVAKMGGLLKQYQEEIDRLTTRSKYSENAFLSVYKLMANAPDPVESLVSLIVRVSIALSHAKDESQKSGRITELEAESRRYKNELEDFRREFQEIQNQEVTILRLKDKLAEYETQMEKLVEEKLEESNAHLHQANQQEIETLREQELVARREVSHLSQELQRIQFAYERSQAQLRELHDSQGARQSETELLVEEVERLRAQLLSEQRQKEQLEETLRGTRVAPPKNSSTALELEIAQKDIEISQLKEHFHFSETQNAAEREKLQRRNDFLAEELEKLSRHSEAVEATLRSLPSPQEIEELKSQLDIYKKTVGWDDSEDSTSVKSVEKLLKDKTKRLETEGIHLRAALQEREESLKSLEDEKQKFVQRIEELERLVRTLEEDIGKNSGMVRSESVDVLLREKNSKGGEEEASMLRIVCQQRDRFKLRIEEVEEEGRRVAHQLEMSHKELETLRADNVKLFEKIRYLQSYGRSTSQVPEEDVEARYSQLYEDATDPFVLFNRKEQKRRYKDLNPAEKVVLNSGRFFLSSKFSRTFLFVYSVALHLLVFLTLYKIAHTTTEIHT